MESSLLVYRTLALSVCLGVVAHDVGGHEGHEAATYQVTPPGTKIETGPHLRLLVTESDSDRPLAARFTVTVNGESYVPQQLGRYGLRFVSRHQRRNQEFVATYSRGNGEVLVPLPQGAMRGTVTATKGFEFTPATESFELAGRSATVRIRLRRWIDLQTEGWHAADEHLHYERTNPAHDQDWLTMLDADGLSHAHFLVLKGGNLDGLWAQQFAYGKAGEASDGQRLIRPGEEYRDTQQGHINLLGINQIIQPISTGGIGQPKIPFNFPPLLDIYRHTHELEGIGGPAHGASFSPNSTASLDTVLGEVDFFEIANSHLLKTEVWYELLNCGFIVPPVAGTDLPNFGFRDPWQPLLGEVRTYVRVGRRHDFETWKRAVRRGETFVTSGPVIRIAVNGEGPGGRVQLPAEGGEVTVTAELASPRLVQSLRIVQMGRELPLEVVSSSADGIQRLTITQTLPVTESCWLAAKGFGQPKAAIEKGLGLQQSVMAHTGVVQVLVGERPIRSVSAVESLRDRLMRQQEFYRTKAAFERAEDRLRFVDLFDQALERLNGQ